MNRAGARTKNTDDGVPVQIMRHPVQKHPPDRSADASVYGTVNVKPMGTGHQDQLPKTGHRVSRIISVEKGPNMQGKH